MTPLLHEPVTFHTDERVGHRRLLHIDAPAKLGLGEAVLFEQHDKGRELARGHAAVLELFLKPAVEQAIEQPDLIAEGI